MFFIVIDEPGRVLLYCLQKLRCKKAESLWARMENIQLN